MKRWLSVLAVFVMMLTMLPVDVMTIEVLAEETSVTDVLNSHGEIRESGNWQYSLIDYGIARIEGYDGDPASLKIPTELDGYAVGAIADGAFSSFTRLTSVTIPTQVFSVGADAFPHPEILTVTGYDGSAGLSWAKANGAKMKSLTDMYINEGVVDLSGVGSAVRKTAEGTLSVNSALSYVLTKGTVFFFTATDKYGMNYWGGRVTSVSRGTGGATVSYEKVESKVLIDKIIASSDMTGLKYDFIPAKDLAFYDDNTVEASKIDIGLVGDIYGRVYDNKTVNLIPSDAIPKNTIDIFGVPVTVNSKLELDFDVLYDPNLLSKDVVTARFDFTMTTTVTAHKEAHWSRSKPLGTVTIYGIKGFRLKVPVDLVVRANGSIDVEVKVIDDFHWSYDNRKNSSLPEPVYTHRKPTNKIVFQGDITVGLQISLALELCFDDILKIGIEGGVKGYGKITLPRNCIDLQAWLYADVFIDTIFTNEKHWNIAKVPLLTNHIEVESLVPFKYTSYNNSSLCTRQDKTIKFDLNGGEPMLIFKDTKVAWGSVFEITGPTKAKHKFIGWYTDQALTQKWTNGSRIYDDITLYAMWEKLYEPVSSLTLNRSSMTIHSSGSDRTGKLTVTVTPSDATNKTVKWSSSDKSVATVDQYGNVTGISRGTATITAVSADNSSKRDSCTVTVQQYVTGISVTAVNPKPLRLGTTQLTAMVSPSNANNQAYTWSSNNPSVATVSSSGLVTANAVGTAIITATASDGSGVTGSVTIQVQPIPVSSVSISKQTATIYTSGDNRTVQLSETVAPSNADNRSVTWTSSNLAVAGVDSTGKVTGMSAGTAVITVRSNDKPSILAQCTVTVKQFVTRLSLSQTSVTLAPNATVQWTASVMPSDATDKSVRWISSNPRVATVSSGGLITGVAGGDAVISAQAKDGSGVIAQGMVHVTGTAAEPVTPDPSVNIESITLSANTLRVFTRGTYQSAQLTAFIIPENAANPVVTWTSSNPAAATVDSTGRVTGVAGGKTTITATSQANSTIKATCQVTVEQLADSISLNLTSKTILKGDTVQLIGTVNPSNATNRNIKWVSSNKSIATVDYRGLVTGVGLGTATIIAEAQDGSGVTASFSLTVNPVPVSSVALPTAVTAYTAGNDHTVQLNPTVLPANAEDPSLTWTSSNTAVATVSQNGVVTGVNQGSATITAISNFDNTKKATCTVTVKTWVTGVTLTVERKVMEPGESLQITAEITPANATDKRVTWKSDNPNVVSVSSAGLMTSHTIGNAVITATAMDGSGVSDSFSVNVTENPVYEIRLGTDTVSLKTAGDNRAYQMTWEVLPAKATDKSVTWTSSDNEIAWVGADGRIIGVSGGTVTVTVQSDSNPEVTASCTVTVTQLVESVAVFAATDTLIEGSTLQLTAEAGPTSASNRALEWTSSNTQVLTVSQNGLVTAVGTGTAVITAAAKDGSGKSDLVTLNVEKWMSLSGNISNSTWYLDGETDGELGEVMLTNTTVARIQQAGLTPVWTLTGGGTHTKLEISEKPVTYQLGDTMVELTSAVVTIKELISGGTDTYTLSCAAGNYSASKNFTVTCDAATYNAAVGIGWSDVTVNLNDVVTVPATPVVSGTGSLPPGLTLTLEGEDMENADVTWTNGSASLKFGTSSVYTFDAVYKVGNLHYIVPVTVRVKGADGLVRLPVQSVTMSAESVSVSIGETIDLTATGAYGAETVNTVFTWESSNPQVATVDQNGKVTAVNNGFAIVYAYPASGRAYGWCLVYVSPAIAFTQDALDMTVYVGGQTNIDLSNVMLTRASVERLERLGVKPVWKLVKTSGESVELAVQELEAIMDETNVRGSALSLVRIYGAGDTVYRLICTAGGQSSEIPVTIHAVVPAQPLPSSVALTSHSYTARIGDTVRVFTDHTVSPVSSALPEDANAHLIMSGAFGKAVASAVTGDGYFDLVFGKSGTFTGGIQFAGINYRYEASFTVTVSDANGHVAVMPEQITVLPDYRFLLVGETAQLGATVLPDNAENRDVIWSSFDESVATVSPTGLVTAIAPGSTVIHAASEDADVFGDATIYVESGLSMEKTADTVNVYLDGLTRTKLDTYYLTYASSARSAGMIPKWTLRRVSGSCLTLTMKETEEIAVNGIIRLGAEISLFSVTRTGTAVYDLTCTIAGQSATTRITVNALERSDTLPDHLSLSETEYSAQVGELIVFEPEITASPVGVEVPADLRVGFEWDGNATTVLSDTDYFVSRARSTFSFSEAGTYYADCVYRSGNVCYTIPVTFRIADTSGQVPVFVTKLQSDPKDLYLEKGKTAQLTAVFSPVNATDQGVVFSSTNTAVATVSAAGLVTAVANGTAQIVLTPSDPHVPAAVCNVTVEQGFNIVSSTDNLELYLQGEQQKILTQYELREGTLRRLAAEGLMPVWTVTRKSGSAATYGVVISDDLQRLTLSAEVLQRSGTDVYTVSCTAGSYSWSRDFTLNVLDLGVSAPASIALIEDEVTMAVGEIRTIQTAPVISPSGASIPQALADNSRFYGIGDFYNALNYEASGDVFGDAGNQLTLCFNQPGTYILFRSWEHLNLRYDAPCVITVNGSGSAAAAPLFTLNAAACTVYAGGQSSVAVEAALNDSFLYNDLHGQVQWQLQRVSGSAVTASLTNTGKSAGFYITNVKNAGTDVWRISATLGGYTQSADITVNAIVPRTALPDSVAVSEDTFTASAGEWIWLGYDVACSPAGTRLPDTGADFWTLVLPDGSAEEVAEVASTDTGMRVRFSEVGLYSGVMKYVSGNAKYEIPVYFRIVDDAGETTDPQLKIVRSSVIDKVWLDGLIGVGITRLTLADSDNGAETGAAAALVKANGANWSVRITSGASRGQLAVAETEPGEALLMLTSVSAVGSIQYQVACSVAGKTYTCSGSVQVVDQNTPKPTLNLAQNTYTLTVGETVVIDRRIIDQDTGAKMASADDWQNDAAIAAMGYGYKVDSDTWTATFYEKGDFLTSVTIVVGNLVYTLPLTFKVVGPGETPARFVLRMPSALTLLEEEAMYGVAASIVDLRGSNVSVIGSKAFGGNPNLEMVYLPASVRTIAGDAFRGSGHVVILCPKGSYAHNWANQNGYAVAFLP